MHNESNLPTGQITSLMVALGFTEPTKGTVKLCGIDITEQPLEAKCSGET